VGIEIGLDYAQLMSTSSCLNLTQICPNASPPNFYKFRH